MTYTSVIMRTVKKTQEAGSLFTRDPKTDHIKLKIKKKELNKDILMFPVFVRCFVGTYQEWQGCLRHRYLANGDLILVDFPQNFRNRFKVTGVSQSKCFLDLTLSPTPNPAFNHLN